MGQACCMVCVHGAHSVSKGKGFPLRLLSKGMALSSFPTKSSWHGRQRHVFPLPYQEVERKEEEKNFPLPLNKPSPYGRLHGTFSSHLYLL